jgi:hypothetical protein
MEAICSSETSVDFQQTTRRYIPEDGALRDHRYENLKSCVGPHVPTFTSNSRFGFSLETASDCGGHLLTSEPFLMAGMQCCLAICKQNEIELPVCDNVVEDCFPYSINSHEVKLPYNLPDMYK